MRIINQKTAFFVMAMAVLATLILQFTARVGRSKKEVPAPATAPAPPAQTALPPESTATPKAAPDTAAHAAADTSGHTSSAAAGKLDSAGAKSVIAGRAADVIAALKAKNFERLTALAHPTKGVRFSPYPNVNLAHSGDRRIPAGELAAMWNSGKKYSWGNYDATGDVMNLTFKDYYKRFMYDRDFAAARDIAYNGAIRGSGNIPNTIHERYPNAIVVEYHFAASDPNFGGNDWKSLWLTFEKNGNEWFLVDIAHGEWTI